MNPCSDPATLPPRPGPGYSAAPDGCGRVRPAGFTLLELLVVAAVIAVQAAILLPALAQVRNASRGVTCLGNLRLWALATHAYAAEHDDLLPPEGMPNPRGREVRRGWYIQLPDQLALPGYLDAPWRTNAAAGTVASPFLCPSNPRRSNGRNLFHYCLNQNVDGSGSGDAPVRLGAIGRPSRLVWLFDTKNLPAVGHAGFVHTNLHGGGAQILFLDGHVRRHRVEEFRDPGRGRSDARSGAPNEGIEWHP